MAIVDRKDYIRLTRYMQLDINHAVSGMQVCTGRNIHFENRIFAVRESDAIGGYILNHHTGQRLEMKAGHIYFMPGNADLEWMFTEKIFFSAIHFNVDIFHGFDLFYNVHELYETQDTEEFNIRLQRAIEGDISLQNISIIKGLTFELIGKFCNLNIQDLKRLEMIRSKYEDLFEYIRLHGDATTSVDELAEVARMSRDRLSRSFSKDIGISLKEWLNRELLKKARKLLLNSNETARGVAAKLNFNSEYYFSRFFKKHCGIPPRQYQKKDMALK